MLASYDATEAVATASLQKLQYLPLSFHLWKRRESRQTEWLKCGHYSTGGIDRKNAQASEVRLTQ